MEKIEVIAVACTGIAGTCTTMLRDQLHEQMVVVWGIGGTINAQM